MLRSRKGWLAFLGAFVGTTMLSVPATRAQQVTGTAGSPSATTTIDGQYLPPPPPKFGGEINLQASQSKPWWPPQVVPPQGAPNILLIMTDDQGYGVSGTFGGVIPTPALDRVATMGLRYTQFHSTALCSPTRAALITGRNHLSVGFGTIAEQSTGLCRKVAFETICAMVSPGDLRCAARENDDGDQFQRSPFSAGDYSDGCAVVRGLSLELPARRRTHAGTWRAGRPRDHSTLGREIQSPVGGGVSSPEAGGVAQLAHG